MVPACLDGTYADGTFCIKCPVGTETCDFTNNVPNSLTCMNGFALDSETKKIQVSTALVPVPICVPVCP